MAMGTQIAMSLPVSAGEEASYKHRDRTRAMARRDRRSVLIASERHLSEQDPPRYGAGRLRRRRWRIYHKAYREDNPNIEVG